MLRYCNRYVNVRNAGFLLKEQLVTPKINNRANDIKKMYNLISAVLKWRLQFFSGSGSLMRSSKGANSF